LAAIEAEPKSPCSSPENEYEYDRGIEGMSGEDASELQDDGRLSAGIVAAGRVGGGVGDETSARIVVAADDDQPIAMFPGSQAITLKVGAVGQDA